MPSPFPGMNPYLEQGDTWEDFHHDFITRTREVLSEQVGPHYLVKIEVRLYLYELSAEERRYLATPPMRLTLPAVDVERHSSLEIRDRRNRRLITVLELLSPTNKRPGADRNDYLAKRAQVLAGPTHLVEIDLGRGGERPRPPEVPPCDYYVLVSRAEERPELDLWPISLRDSLPVVPVPLAAPDPSISLDLQALLHRVYDAADYGKYIYDEAPQPPLSPSDASWAEVAARIR